MSSETATETTGLITGEELYEMGYPGPCELIDGRIVPMSPAGGEHGLIEFILGAALTNFVRQRKLGWVTGGEVGIYTRHNPDRVRGADIAFISKQRSAQPPAKKFLDLAPDLVVEIISPTDRWADMRQKISEYFAIGVTQVWIIEPELRTVLVYSSPSASTTLSESDTLHGAGTLEGFSLPVGELFAGE